MKLKYWNFRAKLPSNYHRAGFGGGSTTSSQSGSSSPWSGQQPYLSDLFTSAQNQYQNYSPTTYGYSGDANGAPVSTGQQVVAPLNSTQTGAINQLSNLGLNGTSTLSSANNSLNPYLSGSMLGTNNPYFQSTANEIQNADLPGFMSSFTQGSTDNPNVAYAASQGLGNAIGNVAEQNYETQSQNQLNAASTAPYLYNTQLAGANAALTGGTTAQETAQNQATAAANAYGYYQNLPYSQINQYSNLINGQYGGTSSGTTTAPSQGLS